MAIVLNPPSGLRDVTQYPDEPGSGAAAREQIQSVIDQVVNQAAAKNDFVNSLAIDGWRKFPDGIVEQWGTVKVNATAGKNSFTITFPIAFPSACYNLILSISSVSTSATSYNYVWSANAPTATGATYCTLMAETAQSIYVSYRTIGR